MRADDDPPSESLSSDPSTSGDGTDPRIPELVAACLDRYQEKGEEGIEEICRENPEAEPAIRLRIERLRELGLLADTAGPDSIPESLGDFRLIRRLGEGGMGVVYLAEQTSLSRFVALKLIRPENLYFPGSKERFEREVLTVSKLQHPGIIAIHAVGEEGGLPYYAMEFMEGCTLAELITELREAERPPRPRDLLQILERRFPDSKPSTLHEKEILQGSRSWPELCSRLIRNVADALWHAHSRGIIHRDVKASNVMVTRDGRVVLVDFGLSMSPDATDLTRSGAVIGSLPYMSPEQVNGETKSIGPLSDIYSLGVLLYELLTLERPYGGPTFEAVRDAILKGRPKEMTNTPWDLSTICSCAMDRDPARRYSSALALVDDLTRVLERRPIRARPLPRWLAMRRWVERNPTLAVTLVSALVVFLIGPSIFAWQVYRWGKEIESEKAAAVEARNQETAQRKAAVEARKKEAAQRRVAEDAERSASTVAKYLADTLKSPRYGRDVTVDELLDRSARTLDSQPPADRRVAIELRHIIGESYRSLMLLDKSEAQLQRVYELTEEFGPESKQHLISTLFLGRLYHSQGRYEEAEKFFKTAIMGFEAREIRERVGPKDRLMATYELADLLRAKGDLDEAETLFQSVLALRESLDEEARATVESSYGSLLFAQGRFGEAKEIFDRVYKFRDARLGPTHPYTLRTRNSLAAVYYRTHQFAEMRAHLQSIIPILEKSFGHAHRDTLAAKAMLASGYKAEGRTQEALPLEREILKIREESYGPNHPDTLRARGNLAKMIAALGRVDEALPLAQQTLEGRLEVLGEEHQDTMISRDQVGIFEHYLGDHESALEHFESAVSTAEEVLGDTHWLTGLFRAHLGGCLVSLDQDDDAEAHLLEAYETLEQAEVKGQLQSPVEQLIRLYEKRGDSENVAHWTRVLREIQAGA